MFFRNIEVLQELIKSYIIATQYSQTKAAELLEQINDLRLEIALDAEGRRIFYEQKLIPQVATGTYQQSIWFSKNDIDYTLRRGIARLAVGASVAAVNEGNRQRVITREQIAWQQVFSDMQITPSRGQQTAFDFPQEIKFAENEAFGLSVKGQTGEDGYIVYHGCTLKDTIEDVKIGDLTAEIESYIPEGQQLVPLIFKFNANTVDAPAVAPNGSSDILSAKNSESVILTEVSTTAPDMRITLIDEGRNQLICDQVEAYGVAATQSNQFTTYYPLPYPHLLRRGDRLRLRGLNGSIITGVEIEADIEQYLTFRGYPV